MNPSRLRIPQSKREEVLAHAVAILSLKMAALIDAGATLAGAVEEHEGRISNPALERWRSAVADARSVEQR